MFGLFKRKSKVERLHDQYKKLLSESHQLSTIDRKKSDKKLAEANELLQKIEKITVNS
jgi:hypothetical protein